MKTLTISCVAALGLALPYTSMATPGIPAMTGMQVASQAAAPTAPKLHAALRALWHGHLVATRDYAIARKAGNKAAEAKAADAVVANAMQISGAVAGFYGADAGKGLLKLLAGHWSGVQALTDATRIGDKAAADRAMQALAINAGEIATFLHTANPANWPAATVQGLLLQHAADHQSLVSAIMVGDKATEGKDWMMMEEHMNIIADALADGIATQFPAKAR